MSAYPERVVVTGLGVVTPLGGDVASTWAALLAGQSGVRSLNESWRMSSGAYCGSGHG